jgi:hypothetical protein
MPTSTHAAVYSATRHYLRAIEAAGTDEAKAVMAKMRDIPTYDFFAKNGKLREDGRMVHDMYLVEVKTPSESSARQLIRLINGYKVSAVRDDAQLAVHVKIGKTFYIDEIVEAHRCAAIERRWKK